MLVALLIFFVPGHTRKWRNMLAACALVFAIGFASIGCGSSSAGKTGTTGTSGGGGTPSKTMATVTVSPANSSIVVSSPMSVALAVSGSGTIVPSGTITLASGSYTSAAANLISGTANVTIPASTLPIGQDTLTASYSGDSNYSAATGMATLTVTSPTPSGGTTPGTYTFTVTGTGNDLAKTSATTTFTVAVS